MTLPKPIWFDYVVWGYDDDKEPYIKGFKKDTPQEVIEAYKKETKEYSEGEGEGMSL